jgi:hypothetical protein
MHLRRADRVTDEADEASDGWTNPAAGLEIYRQACQEHPNDADLWRNYADTLAALERWSEAEAVARDGLETAGFDQDLWVVVLDSLVAQQLPDPLLRELEVPYAASAHPLIVPVYRARALELRGDDTGALMTALSDAYDGYGLIVRFDRAPRYQMLDLAMMLARHGARDEADYCLETLSRGPTDDDVASLAAAAGVALWQGIDDATADQYRGRLDRGDFDEDEIAEAIAEAASSIVGS